MIDHVVVNVSDLDRSVAFYRRALAPLGAELVMEIPGGAGFGRDGRPSFWIGRRDPGPAGVHFAFAAATRGEVDAFHREAIAAGGRDNGPPGPREAYGPTYYGGFVLDPDGNNIEAVTHAPARGTGDRSAGSAADRDGRASS